jgi:hypothetical protein
VRSDTRAKSNFATSVIPAQVTRIAVDQFGSPGKQSHVEQRT